MDWNCSDIRPQAAAYFANQLAAAERKALESHLSSCQACRLDLSETLSGYRIATLALGTSRNSEGLSDQRLDALHRAAAGRSVEENPSRGAEVSRRMGWFVAAASLVVGLASWMGHVAELPAAGVPVRMAAVDLRVSAGLNLEDDFTPSHDYPPSYGVIYPKPFHDANSNVPNARQVLAPIDAESLPEDFFVAHDSASGLGRTGAGGAYRSGWEDTRLYYGGWVAF